MALNMRDPKTGREIDFENVTIRHGYWFFFDDGEDEIVAHGSAKSGKEWIYFNDDLVSEKRNFTSRTTKHQFHRNGHDYELVFYMTSLMYGHLECTLYKDGVEIGKETREFMEKGFKKKNLWYLLPFFAAGFAGGWLGADYLIPFLEPLFEKIDRWIG